MIQANELRIGNWVKYQFHDGLKEVKICSNDFKMLDDKNLNKYKERYEPIPLTEQELLNIGFEYYKPLGHYRIVIEDVWYSVHINYLGLKGFFFSFINLNADETESMPMKKVKYVHKLQNLFFELSSKELNYESKS
jgi:hypothetical protein